MKTSLVIFVLLVLSFAVKATEPAAVDVKSYYFEYQYEQREGMRQGDLQWYQEIELYVDGKYVETFNIGNQYDVDIAWGFTVPVGSEWQLEVVKTVATKNGSQIALSVSYPSYGNASSAQTEEILVQVGPY